MSDVETSVYARWGQEETELARLHHPRIEVKEDSILVDGVARYTMQTTKHRVIVTDLTDPFQPWHYLTRDEAINAIAWYEGGTVADSA